MDDVPDELVARARDGDREAFNELVRRTYQRVYSQALRLTGNEQDAFDVVQDTYVRAYRGLQRFRQDARFTTWLHRITTNTASTFRERRTRHSHRDIAEVPELHSDDLGGDPELSVESGALRDRLADALNGLPARLRSVVVLRDVQGMSHREIAAVLDITESAAKVRLHRARHRLREVLSRDEDFADRVVQLRPSDRALGASPQGHEEDPLKSAG